MVAEERVINMLAGNGHSVPLLQALPSFESGWLPRPFQIVSLLDMLRFYAGIFQVAFLMVGHFEREFQRLCDQGLGELPLDETMLQKFSAVTKVALDEAEKVQFQKA